MSALICGSVAYDNIMVFEDSFKNHILPIDVTLRNPTQFTGYDVRGTIISNTPWRLNKLPNINTTNAKKRW